MTGWIVIGVLGVAAVLTLPRVPVWVYHWRAAAHVITMTEAEPVPAPEYLAVPGVVAEAARTLAESEEHRVRYGSMIRDEELALHHEVVLGDWGGWISGPMLDPGEWTDELLAELHDGGPRPRGMTEPAAPDDVESSVLPGQEEPEGIPGPADGPRNMDATPGAGDESEASGPPAPPAPAPYAIEAWAPKDFQVNWVQPEPSRLLRTIDEIFREGLAADAHTFMARQDAETREWLAGSRERWAVA